MYGLLAAIAVSHEHHCLADSIQNDLPVFYEGNYAKRSIKSDEKKQSIRIHINYDQLETNYTDEFKCSRDKIGQIIQWGN